MEKLEARENVMIDYVSELPESWREEKEVFLSENIQSLLLVPISRGSDLFGFAGFDSVRRTREWGEEEINLLRIFGNLLGSAYYRRRLKKKSEERKRRLKLALEGGELGTWDWNVRTGEFRFDKRWAEMKGYDPDELEYRSETWKGMVHPDDLPEARVKLNEHLEGEADRYEVEFRMEHKSDGWIWILERGRVVNRDERGKPVRVAGTQMDITERKQAEKELKRQQNLFESIMTLTPDLVYFKDEQHQFERVNDGYTELLGLDEEEMIGKTASDFWPESEEIMEDERRALSGEPVIGRERKVTLPNGETRWYSINKLPRRDSDGNVIGFLGIDRDITERKRMEKELNEREREMSILLSNLPGMAYRCKNDKDWSMEFVSEGCEDITGYKPRELIDNQLVSYGDLIVEEDREMVWQRIQDQVDTHSTYELEYRIRTKNGELKWVWEQGRGVFDSKGQLQNLQGLITDISDRKRTEQALVEERKKLRNLHTGVEELQRQDTEEEILQTAVDVAERMLDFELCDISTLEGDYLVSRASSTDLDTNETSTFEVGEGIAGKTFQKGETFRGDDVRNYPDAKPTNESFRAFISVPIGEMGVLQVISQEKGSFSERDEELVEVLANHLMEELKRVRLEEELKEQAIRDPLTGLYNRRYFNETLEKEVQKSKRYDEPLAFLMLDVDRFKEVNDRYSHQTGDKVLQEVANLLKNNFRGADTVVRYGGDEFLVMMPETDGGVTNTIDRLKLEVEQWNDQSELLDFPLTLSMGFSHWSPEQERGIEKALKEADEKMYDDKRR